MFRATLVIIGCLKLLVESSVFPFCDSNIQCVVLCTRPCISWCWVSLSVVFLFYLPPNIQKNDNTFKINTDAH
jgi:hypothetical protein